MYFILNKFNFSLCFYHLNFIIQNFIIHQNYFYYYYYLHFKFVNLNFYYTHYSIYLLLKINKIIPIKDLSFM